MVTAQYVKNLGNGLLHYIMNINSGNAIRGTAVEIPYKINEPAKVPECALKHVPFDEIIMLLNYSGKFTLSKTDIKHYLKKRKEHDRSAKHGLIAQAAEFALDSLGDGTRSKHDFLDQLKKESEATEQEPSRMAYIKEKFGDGLHDECVKKINGSLNRKLDEKLMFMYATMPISGW